ncbi:MAG: molybdopterin oxidoreductase family protein [Planctomycetes bacterium]|nr:molybdopterin oxidoreductase family protein [Planctomycetota bacterium]
MPTARKIVKTTCSHDCPDACSVLITVEDGKAVHFAGDPDHPFTRGFLCGKVNGYERMVYSPDRLLQPLKRAGPKGATQFERLSWDEAIATIAARLQETKGRHGGEAIVQYYYAGTMGYVHRFCADALFNKLGATRLRPNICYYGADAGYNAVTGGGYGLDPEDLVHSDHIIIWGCNVVSTQVHLVPFIDEARKRGAKLTVIDPYRNRTASIADEFLKIPPGADTALALAMARVIVREGRADEEFLAVRTQGFERFRDEVLPQYPPERSAEITGLPVETILRLAREYAAARAPVIKFGIGLGRNSNGPDAVRAICCLAGVAGAYMKTGGGVLYDSGCEFKPNLSAVTRPDWLERPVRSMNMTDLARALTEWRDPPIKFLYIHSSNPAATAPEQERLARGLGREDLFTVVHERFPTDTVRYADLVLPAPTFAEVDDLYKSYGHLYLQRGRAAIPPRGECRSNLEVIQSIGKALGFKDPWFSKSVEDFIRELLQTGHPNFKGVTAERILAGETVRLNIPRGTSGYRERFPTASGKLEFYSKELEEAGLPPMPGYWGDGDAAERAKHPFRLLTPPAHHFLNTSFGASEASRRRAGGEPRVMVHPEDAARLGIADGDLVEARNDVGAARLLAQVTDATQPGVLIAEGTWWPWHGRGGRGINALTSARVTRLGGGSMFHDSRVALRRAQS